MLPLWTILTLLLDMASKIIFEFQNVSILHKRIYEEYYYFTASLGEPHYDDDWTVCKIPCFCLRRYDHREKINCLFQLQQYDTGHKSVYWMNVKCESKQTDVPYRWICNDNRFFIIQSLADPIKYGHFFLDSDEGKWKLMKFSRWP